MWLLVHVSSLIECNVSEKLIYFDRLVLETVFWCLILLPIWSPDSALVYTIKLKNTQTLFLCQDTNIFRYTNRKDPKACSHFTCVDMHRIEMLLTGLTHLEKDGWQNPRINHVWIGLTNRHTRERENASYGNIWQSMKGATEIRCLPVMQYNYYNLYCVHAKLMQ